mgnify:CR=1 FL=1
MYGPTDLKKNTLITLDGQPYKVIEYSQKVMGRGGSIVNVRVKNLITGALIPKTFKGQEKSSQQKLLPRKCSISIVMKRNSTSWIQPLLSNTNCLPRWLAILKIS